MAQRLDLGLTQPSKLQSETLNSYYSLKPSILSGASLQSHPDVQNKKDHLAALKSVPWEHSQEDCPDGGLQAWLVVLGVRLPVYLSLGGGQPHTLGFMCYLLNVSTASSTQPTFDHSFKILMTSRRCGYANSWGVSGLGQFSFTRIVDAHHSPCCALGFSRLLRECLAKRNLTFYDVRPIYFSLFSFHFSTEIVL
jgi:hypothetical protein